MVGQEELTKRLNNLTISNLPHSLVLVGEYGCGKHTFVKEISDKLNINMVDISKELSDDKILELQQKTEHAIYLIDSNLIKEKDQNIILKILEEPTDYMHIIILCNSLKGLLSTIINRCNIWKFKKYDKSILKTFSNLADNVFNNIVIVLNTPGKLKNITENISQYIDDTCKIFDYIDRALISNILVLPNKLSFNDKEENKLDFDIFCNLLLDTALKYYLNNKINFEAYLLTNKLVEDSKIFSIDKRKLYENYLINLKDELKRAKNIN